MLLEVQKLQKKYEELKVECNKKDTVILTQGAELQKKKSNLVKLQSSHNELSTAASINAVAQLRAQYQ